MCGRAFNSLTGSETWESQEKPGFPGRFFCLYEKSGTFSNIHRAVNYIYDVYYDVVMNHMPFSTDNL